MKGFYYLVLTQPVGVLGVANTVSDSLGLSSFEKLLLLSPHFHFAECFDFSIEDWSRDIFRVHPLGSCDCCWSEKQPQNWSGNWLKGVQGIAKGDRGDPSATAEHTDEEVTKAIDRTDETTTKDMGFDQEPEISED